MIPALIALRGAVPKLVVVSNANGVLHRMFDRVGLTRYFDVICDSCVEGIEKPDPRFFQIALDRSASRPETTLHVGDLYYVDIVGARRAGLDAILVDAAGLYEDADCARVRTLGELAARVAPRQARSPGAAVTPVPVPHGPARPNSPVSGVFSVSSLARNSLSAGPEQS